MVAFSHRGIWQARLALLGSVGVLWVAQVGAQPRAHDRNASWNAAVEARREFEAEPAGSHTRQEYARVMDNFRAIYHGDPGDPHAAWAVQEVAELLAEQGHELGDAKSLKDAAGQYRFLLQQYPASVSARQSRDKPDELMTEFEHPEKFAAQPSRASEDVAARPAAERVPAASEAAAVPVNAVAKPVEADSAAKKMATVTGIRYWSTPTYTRIAIDLGDRVTYEAARVEHPDRIYFDLYHAKLAHELWGKSFDVTDNGFLERIRAAQFSNDVTRVVLDVHQVAEYSAFLLPNPYRLIIDIHGKAAAPAAQQVAASSAAEPRPAAAAPSESSGREEVSSLPPMAVTDGSSGFGLPARRDEPALKRKAVAPPRVVISSTPTEAKPVPNTVVTHSGDSTPELAAVSLQPGRVEATRHPTSRPIAEKTAGVSEAAVLSRSRRSRVRVATAHVVGEPAEVAPPTADGETSLMRALGLKIGRIVIDAGHGGHDSGTLGVGGIEEKDVVLDVALRLGKLLHDRLGAEIVYTRADDTFIPLETRTAIANKAQADLFISVHANSSPDASARGVEVYYLNFTSDPDAMRVASRENAVSQQSVHELSDLVKQIALKDKIEESKELAADVDESLYKGLEKGNSGLKNRGVKKAPFVVLIGANMPSILAEISFVTNPTDAAELREPAYRERVAESLFKGVERYAEAINGNRSRHISATERASLAGN